MVAATILPRERRSVLKHDPESKFGKIAHLVRIVGTIQRLPEMTETKFCLLLATGRIAKVIVHTRKSHATWALFFSQLHRAPVEKRIVLEQASRTPIMGD